MKLSNVFDQFKMNNAAEQELKKSLFLMYKIHITLVPVKVNYVLYLFTINIRNDLAIKTEISVIFRFYTCKG